MREPSGRILTTLLLVAVALGANYPGTEVLLGDVGALVALLVSASAATLYLLWFVASGRRSDHDGS